MYFFRMLVLRYYEEQKEQRRKEIQDLKAKKVKFGITTDEYTSIKNTRYLSINAHGNGQVLHLGLSPIHGAMPAEKVAEMIQECLQDFGLDLTKDVVASTTDGARYL